MSLIIGHRGARGLAPENTLASLQIALDYGVHEIEIDVRVTKDGVCVLSHDPYLHDASGGKMRAIRITNYTFAQLRQHRPDLLTLEDAITAVQRKVPLVIEIKPRVPSAHVIAILSNFLKKGWQPGDFLVASFSQHTLQLVHRALPQLELVVNERISGLRATWRAKRLGATRIALNHHNIWWGFVSTMNRRGYRLTTFSLNDPKKSARWVRRGLYGTITDFPDRFKHHKK